MKFSLARSGISLLLVVGAAWCAGAKGPVVIDPAKADGDYTLQGEYRGEIDTPDGKIKVGIQVIAMGEGAFRAVTHVGGLPGDDSYEQKLVEVDGTKDGAGDVTFRGEHGVGVLHRGAIDVTMDGKEAGSLKKVERKSPTLGAKPPAGAVVLFDGTSADSWEAGKVEEGLLVQGTTSKQKFQSHRLHLEFRLPFQPEDRGQARGNSGLYLQGRYEVQMLDSFGLEGKDNECGGIYTIRAPRLNMCYPPLAWQTYDIDFTAAKYDAGGKLAAHPRITVRHNGVLVQDNVELPQSTTAAPNQPGADAGPIYLQNHGNPVRYRNIWVLPTDATDLQVGDVAPSFHAVDQNGKPWRSEDVVGKKSVVVYFYPAAHTPGCTKQACAFRDDMASLQDKGVEVVGISGDQPLNLKLFADVHQLNFTLLSDFDGSVAKAFGVPLREGGKIERKLLEKDYTLQRGVTAARWTFLIDKQGKIAWKNTQVDAAEDSKSILSKL